MFFFSLFQDTVFTGWSYRSHRMFFCLDDAFEALGGVPAETVTDNMKTVMDIPRTRGSFGKINGRFQQLSQDYGFRVQPCVAATPRTKGKLESPMRILDELRAYNGKTNLSWVCSIVGQD